MSLGIFLVSVCYMVLNCVQKFIQYKHTFSATLTFKYANMNKLTLDPPQRIINVVNSNDSCIKGYFFFFSYRRRSTGYCKASVQLMLKNINKTSKESPNIFNTKKKNPKNHAEFPQRPSIVNSPLIAKR